MLDYELGTVMVVSVPRVEDGGSAAVDPGTLTDRAEAHDLLAAVDSETLAAVHAAGMESDIRFETRLRSRRRR